MAELILPWSYARRLAHNSACLGKYAAAKAVHLLEASQAPTKVAIVQDQVDQARLRFNDDRLLVYRMGTFSGKYMLRDHLKAFAELARVAHDKKEGLPIQATFLISRYVRPTEALVQLCTTSRHMRVSFIYEAQSIRHLMPAVRVNVNCVFVTSMPVLEGLRNLGTSMNVYTPRYLTQATKIFEHVMHPRRVPEWKQPLIDLLLPELADIVASYGPSSSVVLFDGRWFYDDRL